MAEGPAGTAAGDLQVAQRGQQLFMSAGHEFLSLSLSLSLSSLLPPLPSLCLVLCLSLFASLTRSSSSLCLFVCLCLPVYLCVCLSLSLSHSLSLSLSPTLDDRLRRCKVREALQTEVGKLRQECTVSIETQALAFSRQLRDSSVSLCCRCGKASLPPKAENVAWRQ